MICPVCFGRKYDFKKDGNSGYFVECKKCHGTGIVEPQTNEEWFCGLSTKEKSEWLSNRDEFIYDCGQRGFTPKIMDKDEWQEWLKQPHRGE